jgi:hypothetical protein
MKKNPTTKELYEEIKMLRADLNRYRDSWRLRFKVLKAETANKLEVERVLLNHMMIRKVDTQIMRIFKSMERSICNGVNDKTEMKIIKVLQRAYRATHQKILNGGMINVRVPDIEARQ